MISRLTRQLVSVTAAVLTCIASLGVSSAQAEPSLAEVVRTMEEGQWKELPDTRLRDVFPDRDSHPHWGTQGPKSVTRAWSGGAYDTKRNRLIVKGGGHGAYGGNEVYEFDLESMEWRRATEPSAHEVDPAFSDRREAEKYFRTVDDTPVSRHTYDSMVYDPVSDKVFMWGGSLFRIGNAYDRYAWVYDPESRDWERGAEASQSNIPAVSAFDPNTGRVVVEYGHGIFGYDVDKAEWMTLSSGNNNWGGRAAEIDPERNLFIQVHDPNGPPVLFYDLGAGSGRQRADVSGDLDFATVPNPGLAYHPPTGYMTMWNGWRHTWVMNPDTWEVRRIENLPGPAPDHYGTDPYPIQGKYKTIGIYGRWAYVPDYDVFIGYGHVDDNVWLYKLPEDPFNWVVPAGQKARECPADLCVGPDFDYRQPSHAASEARDGDTILIQEGEYEDCARWRVSVTIKGFEGRPRIGNKICHGKAVWITQGDDTEIENVELHGGHGPGRNGESIRHEGKRLVVRDSVIHSSRMGILTNHNSDIQLEVYDSEFYGMRSRSGLSHHVYAGRIGRFVAEGNNLHDTSVGHRLKSVADENIIRYNYAENKENAGASLIDIWGCSDTEIVGNSFVYGGDGGALQAISLTHRNHRGSRLPCDRDTSTAIAYNTAVFVSPESRWSSFVRNHFGVHYDVTNNLVANTRDFEFEGSRTGLGRLEGNAIIGLDDFDLFVDPTGGDVRLTRSVESAVVDDSALPERSYSHPAGTVIRQSSRSPGAFEYAPD